MNAPMRRSGFPEPPAESRSSWLSTVGLLLAVVLGGVYLVLMFPVENASKDAQKHLTNATQHSDRIAPAYSYRQCLTYGASYPTLSRFYPTKRRDMLKAVAKARLGLAQEYAGRGLALASAAMAEDYLAMKGFAKDADKARGYVEWATGQGFSDKDIAIARQLRGRTTKVECKKTGEDRNGVDWSVEAEASLRNGSKTPLSDVVVCWFVSRHGYTERAVQSSLGPGAAAALSLSYSVRARAEDRVRSGDVELIPVSFRAG